MVVPVPVVPVAVVSLVSAAGAGVAVTVAGGVPVKTRVPLNLKGRSVESASLDGDWGHGHRSGRGGDNSAI